MIGKKNTKWLLFLVGALFLFLFTGNQQAQAAGAKLYFSPASSRIEVGQASSVRLMVDTSGQAINLVQGNLSYSSNLEITSFSKSSSILKLWFDEPKTTASSRTISFSGGIPNPGFSGTGTVLIINFRAKKAGAAWFKISSAQVLANDGVGTNILSSTSEAKLTFYETGLPKPVQPAPAQQETPSTIKVFSSTHPDEKKWYKEKNIILSWAWQPGITNYSYLLDQKQQTIPDNSLEGPATSTAYLEIAEGIWYFHLKAKTATDWSETTHFKIQIDTASPTGLKIFSDQGEKTFNPSPTIRFEAKDGTSGIDYYGVKINEGEFMKVETNNLQLPQQKPGNYLITVRAVDRAGNYQEGIFSLVVVQIPSPEIRFWEILALPNQNQKYLNIKGGATPTSKIKIYLNERDGRKYILETETDKDGNWDSTSPESLSFGKYEAYALASLAGMVSLPSGKIEFEVVEPGSKFFTQALSWALIIILISGLAIILIIFVKKLLYRSKR